MDGAVVDSSASCQHSTVSTASNAAAGRIDPLLAQYAGARIHRAPERPVHALDRTFVAQAAPRVQRHSTLSVTFTEGQLYLDIDGHSLSTSVDTRSLGNPDAQ